MGVWVTWGILLVLQQAAATWSSRSRNGKNVWWHVIAAVFSNGVWIISLGFAVDKLAKAWDSGSLLTVLGTALFYTFFAVLGSAGSHYILMHHIEKRVGA